MRNYRRKNWFLSLTTFILKTLLITLVVLVVLAFAGVQPLVGYKDTITGNTKSNLATPARTNTGTVSSTGEKESNTNGNNANESSTGIWDKIVVFFRQAKSVLPSTLARTTITDVEGESTFVITVEPNKDALDFEKIYCVVLTAKDGYVFSHEQIIWLEFEFRLQTRDDRSAQSNLNGLRIVRLSAPAMDKAIFPMRQEISQLVAEKQNKAESDFNEWFWDGRSLAPYTEESIQGRYSVSASERASIARKYVDVKVMLYDDYLTMEKSRGQ